MSSVEKIYDDEILYYKFKHPDRETWTYAVSGPYQYVELVWWNTHVRLTMDGYLYERLTEEEFVENTQQPTWAVE